MRDEMRFHLEMEAERLAREDGLTSEEARRRAAIAFGGVEKYKEKERDARGFRWLDALSLDARLGARMLLKHRGFTLVGGFAMTMSIGLGATCFEVLGEVLNPALPFDDGDRVVALKYQSTETGQTERRILHDLIARRQELRSVDYLSAFRITQRNLVGGSTAPEPVKLAEMTASGFAIAGSPALAGRHLLPSDEAQAAPPVVVIGYRAWQSRFAADPRIVGRAISLGGTAHTVVGVMPEEFGFPVNHQFWIPLRMNPLDPAPLGGPELHVFGRLAPGASVQQAKTELATIAQREAVHAETQRLRPSVLPYTHEHVDVTDPAVVLLLRLAQLLFGGLTFVVAVNLAILIYARTVTRLGEIAVRSALGASRGRILAQLFVEAFALTLVGAVAGLMLAHTGLGTIQSFAAKNGTVPFWISFDLSITTSLYAVALAAGAALIMGVLPGLKATGRSLTANLHELSGRTGTRLGPVWNTLVVAQVAVASAVLPAAVFMAWQTGRMHLAGPGFAAERFVIGIAGWSPDDAADRSRVSTRQRELMSRLRAEPAVEAVTFSAGVPGFAGSDGRLVFESGAALDTADPAGVSVADVGVGMFEVYEATILAGRTFEAQDLGATGVVIVNETLARRFLPGGVLGARFRYAEGDGTAQSSPAYEIIGVVRDFPAFSAALTLEGEPVVYHPVAPGDVHPIAVSVRFRDSIPPRFGDRFRAIGAEVDPSLQLRRVVPLSSYYADLRSLWRSIAVCVGLITASVLLLSAAGIYALMSFTLAQRTREIGIRIALGAAPSRLLLAIFGRASRQLAIGVFGGSVLAGAGFLAAGVAPGLALPLLLCVAGLMGIVGTLAAFGPARRGLRIQANEALRAEG